MSFHCSIVTPEEQAFDAQVTQAIIPAHDGLLGILDSRAPLLVRLGIGPLRLDLPGGTKRYFFLNGGVAQMRDNNLSIVTGQAVPAEELDYESAQAEYAEAAARRTTDDASAEQRQREMDAARVKQSLAR